MSMIKIPRVVVEQALDALEGCMGLPNWPSLLPSINALREALAQPAEASIKAAQAFEQTLQPAAQPTAQAYESALDEYLEGYEMIGETEDGVCAFHRPTESERILIKDAIMGFEGPAAQEPAGETVAFVKSLDVPAGSFVTDLKYCSCAEHDSGDHLKYIPLFTRPAVEELQRLAPFVHGLGKSILAELIGGAK